MVEPINDGESYQITTCHSTGFAVLAETLLKGDADRMAASPDLGAVVQAFIGWYDRSDGDTSDLAFVAEAGRLALAKAFEGQTSPLGKTQPSPSQGLTTWPDFDEDGLPNGAVCIGQDGSAMGVAFDTPTGPSAAATATLWSTAREAIEALCAMMVFDDPGLRGLILSSGRRHGWTQGDYDQQLDAIIKARSVMTKVKGGGQ
jgi:hypothetical protein